MQWGNEDPSDVLVGARVVPARRPIRPIGVAPRYRPENGVSQGLFVGHARSFGAFETNLARSTILRATTGSRSREPPPARSKRTPGSNDVAAYLSLEWAGDPTG